MISPGLGYYYCGIKAGFMNMLFFYKKLFIYGNLIIPASFFLCTPFLTGCSGTVPFQDVDVKDTTEMIAENMASEMISVPALSESDVVDDSETDLSEETVTTDGIKEQPADGEDETIETETAARVSRIEKTVRAAGYDEGETLLSEPPEITYEYSDGYYEYYSFDYAGKEFYVLHEYDNWKISDSYKIRNTEDMQLICEALLDIYPVHGEDLESCRTPEDMAYEWIQHNIVYEMPLTDARYKENAANVDLDPGDQNKTIMEMFKGRR